MVWTISLQSRNRDTDTEKKRHGYQGEKEGQMSWESGADTCTLLVDNACKIGGE